MTGTTWRSGIILACLALQAAAIAGSVSGLLWPFTDYPMYHRAHAPGDTVSRYVVVAEAADGTETVVTPAHLGLNFWKFKSAVVDAFFKAPAEPAAQEALRRTAQRMAQHAGQPIVRLRLENHPWVVMRRGGQDGPREVRQVWEMGPS